MRAKRTGRFPVLSLGDIELGVADPIPDCALVAERQPGDVAPGFAHRNTSTWFADDDHYLAFVVELRALGRAKYIAVMTGE